MNPTVEDAVRVRTIGVALIRRPKVVVGAAGDVIVDT